MAELRDTLERWLPRARSEVERYRPEARLEQVGRIERIGDGVATVSGLPDVRLDELLRFADGTLGYAVELQPETIGCVLLGRLRPPAGRRAGSTPPARCSRCRSARRCSAGSSTLSARPSTAAPRSPPSASTASSARRRRSSSATWSRSPSPPGFWRSTPCSRWAAGSAS